MTSNDFFERIESHYNNQLPFVVYRKPNRTEVKALMQTTDALLFSEDFTETGFVFSPFDDTKKSVLIPLDLSEVISISDCQTAFIKGTSVSTSVSLKEKQNHINLIKKGVDAIKINQFKKVVLSRKETVSIFIL